MQNVIAQGKAQNKAVYLLTIDSHAGKIMHMNYVPKSVVTPEFDAKIWAATVSDIIGGKVSRHL